MGQTFEELIGLHLDNLYSAALCFTLDERAAEDLIQEASIRAFHELSRDRGRNDFKSAMLRVLVSTYLRRQRRMGQDPLAFDGELVSEMLHGGSLHDVEPFPEPGTPGYRLLRDWIGRVWADLSDGDRLVLWLADVERLRHSLIAELTGLDERLVRARHYRARRTLSRGAARELGARLTGGARS